MDTQTAMLLTQEEWDDLTDIVAGFKRSTQWMEGDAQRRAQSRRHPQHVARLDRQRKLADRIIEANS